MSDQLIQGGLKLRGRCLCALQSRCDERPDVYGLSPGCLDTDPGVRPEMHIPSMASRLEITGALPRYEEGPPR